MKARQPAAGGILAGVADLHADLGCDHHVVAPAGDGLAEDRSVGPLLDVTAGATAANLGSAASFSTARSRQSGDTTTSGLRKAR